MSKKAIEKATKQQINEKIKTIYEQTNFNLDETLKECLKQGLVNSKKQLIGKLVYMKIYKKAEKQEKTNPKRITKKDMINEIEKISGISDLFGLLEAKKETLENLLKWFRDFEEIIKEQQKSKQAG